MANVDTPMGLVPIRHRNGAPYTGSSNSYYVNSGYGTALGIGDPVIKVAGGSNTAHISVPGGYFPIGTLASIEKATAGDTNRITGVIVGFYPDPTSPENILNPADTERVAMVCDDPDVIFEIQADGAIPALSIGLNAALIFTHAASAFTGKSGVELDTTTGEAPSVDASQQLLIMRAINRTDNDTTLTHAKVEVMINQHTENQGTVGTAGV